ncbi:hypothetical protein [Pararhodonellum marinum]|uniref:hypothetical protein n=1 Tax=Pararhodonellum marinum TaxID=2755358 RepID=UPI00188FED8F|nr:hypothetical protein [Pararhodonellum marinum]
MKRVFKLIFLLFWLESNVGPQLHAQVIHNQEGYQLLYDIGLGKHVKFRFESDSTKVEGHPLLFDGLIEGMLMYQDGTLMDPIYFNFYPEKNQLFVQKENGPIYKVNLSKLAFVETYAQPCRKFQAYLKEGQWHLFEVIYENIDGILLAENLKVKDASLLENTHHRGPKKVVYEASIRYFWLQGDQWTDLPKGKKGLKWIAGSQWEKGKTYLKSQKNKEMNPENLRKFCLYLESET